MTFKEQVLEAANSGHRQKPEHDQWCAQQRILEEKRLAEADLALTARAKEKLKSLPGNVREAARKGEKTCFAALVLHQEIERYEDRNGRPPDPSGLKGEARRIFELLEADQLEPFVFVTDFGWHYIMIHVPQATAAQVHES